MTMRDEERRRHKRIAAQIRIRMSDTFAELVQANGMTQNLSLGGACIELDQKVPVFSVCKLFLGNHGSLSCELDGRILWLRELDTSEAGNTNPYLVGVQFLSFNSEEKRKSLLELMGNAF